MSDNNQESSTPSNGPDNSDEMSAEELAAFNKIMGEIEGGEEPSTTESTPDRSATDPAAESPDDFSAELEKVVKEADGGDAASAAETDDASGDDDLDEDQQKALESIMAQIGGGDESAPSEADDDKAERETSSKSDGDFSAELEKVVKEADDGDAASAAETDDASGDDDLDEDQLKAFESIMAQIGNGDDSPADGVPGDYEDEAEHRTQDEEVAAEPEDRVQQDDAPPTEPAGPTGGDGDDRSGVEITNGDANEDSGSPDSDQQEAFEGIMAEIEGAASEPGPDPLADEHVSTDRSFSPSEKAPAQTDEEVADDDVDGEAEDISDVIDELIKDVAVDEQSPAAWDPDASDSVETSHESTANAEQDATVEKGRKEVSADVDTGEDEIRSAATDTAERDHPTLSSAVEPVQSALPLQEAGRSKEAQWKKMALGAATIAFLLLVLVGHAYWPGRFIEKTNSIPARPEEDAADSAALVPQPVQPRVQASEAAVQRPSDQLRLRAVADALEKLRGRLLAKQNEIEELRAYYTAGIDSEIQGIVRTINIESNGQWTHTTAMKDPRVSLAMEAIQRRDTYIRKLVAPSETLLWNSEELLYFFRMTHLLERMTTKTSDIDVDGFVGRAEAIIAKHAEALETLNIDAVPASPLPMKTIWKNIVNQLPRKAENTGPFRATIDNAAISASICNGNFAEKHKLTELTAETARCLSKWDGKDLFLNEVQRLHPEAARQLASWQGEWLGLNGLEALSPEAAVHLSRWPGKGLSLNGLTQLSPRVVAILSEWQGDQIELVNVRHMAHWDNPNTRLFLSEALNRKRETARNQR